MNRSDRKAAKKQAKKMWPGGYVEIPDDLADRLSTGDTFTIKGYKRLPNGQIITDCDPGEETVWTAK